MPYFRSQDIQFPLPAPAGDSRLYLIAVMLLMLRSHVASLGPISALYLSLISEPNGVKTNWKWFKEVSEVVWTIIDVRLNYNPRLRFGWKPPIPDCEGEMVKTKLKLITATIPAQLLLTCKRASKTHTEANVKYTLSFYPLCSIWPHQQDEDIRQHWAQAGSACGDWAG